MSFPYDRFAFLRIIKAHLEDHEGQEKEST